MTPAQQQAACDLAKSGTSFRQVAKQFGISRCALERVLKDNGYTNQGRQKEPTLTPEQQQEARNLLKLGMSLREMAKVFGTTHQTLARYLKKGNDQSREQ